MFFSMNRVIKESEKGQSGESNPQPSDPQSDALTVELHSPSGWRWMIALEEE